MVKEAKKESYAESIRRVVVRNQIEVSSIEKIQELVLLHRQQVGLLRPDDLDCCKGSRTQKRWQNRVRSGLGQLRQSGECALIGKAKYRFFI